MMSDLQTTLSEIWRSFVANTADYLPSLVAALALLLVGWLLALIVSRLVRKGLERTTIDNRIAAWMKGDPESLPDIEKGIGRGVFWLVMLFVLVGFFQTLRLTAVTGPLDSFLDQIFEYLPRLLSAGLLLALAWALATGVRLLVRGALGAVRLDERLGGVAADVREAERASLTQMVSETVYWLIFLLFLPAVLDALALRGLLSPVDAMVGEVLDFLPNLFAALLIFFIGWFVARIVRRIVTNLLGAVGLDEVGERVGMGGVLGKQRLSGLIGLVVYTLVLIPVLISALNALQLDAITRPASSMLDQILRALPALFGAALVLVVAFVIARVVAGLVTNVLRAAGFNRLLERLGVQWQAEAEGDGPSSLVGHLVVVVVMLFATIEALELLSFEQLAALVSSFTVFLGNVLLGLVIFGLGLYLASLAARAIGASGTRQAPLLATTARVAILVLAGAMALRQMNVAEDIINLAFGLLLGAAAVAAAIAFGIGGRDLARQELERWSNELRGGPEM